ncbi:hypothetical protein ALO79_200278 [Pseudomonas syringae pv. castaneae]|uniref:Uncharacterized protein n=1 Tax=Pseudomonas syringae pv. castaneae TaxID=264450 RepID=A0A0P9M9V7_PSESX|nr:hypothetical protein ALO79_200278 [Pseudomonas syringae pv. castaneae]
MLIDAVGHDSPGASPGLNQIESSFIRGKGKAVRPFEIFSDTAQGAVGIEAIEVGRQFGCALAPHVVTDQAERRVGEPDAVVGLHHDVIGRVQRLARKAFSQHRGAAVVLGAGDAPPAMLTDQQTTLTVAGHAIGLVRGLAKHAQAPCGLVPAHDAIVGQVGEQQESTIGEPCRAFCPAQAATETLDLGMGQTVVGKTRVQLTYPGIGHAWAGRPGSLVHRLISEMGGRQV